MFEKIAFISKPAQVFGKLLLQIRHDENYKYVVM